MIIYNDIIKKLKTAGYNTNRIRSEKILSESTLTKIRNNKAVSTDTINVICNLTKLQPADLMEHRDDNDK